MNTIQNIEACKFECEAGSLEMNVSWQELKTAVSLFVIRLKGTTLSAQTTGNGGWGFYVFTNEEEAQVVANSWNRNKFAGQPFYTVHPFLSVTAFEKQPPGTLKSNPQQQSNG